MRIPHTIPKKTHLKSLESAEAIPRTPLSLLWAPLLAGALIATAGSSIAGETLLASSTPGVDHGGVLDRTNGGGRDIDPADDYKSNGPDEPGYPLPDAWISRGTLHVQGTQSKDRIDVEISGASVEVTIFNNANPLAPVEIYSGSFNKNQVSRLRLYGLAGKDLIQNKTSIPDFIWGGLGDDDIICGDGVSYAYGQDGSDIISGNGGNDFLYGGDETDYVFGGPGSDLVEGGDDVDWISGGDQFGGSDNMIDKLVGGAGGDIFTVPPAELAEDILFDYDPMEDSLN